jgi:hypothetical protein
VTGRWLSFTLYIHCLGAGRSNFILDAYHIVSRRITSLLEHWCATCFWIWNTGSVQGGFVLAFGILSWLVSQDRPFNWPMAQKNEIWFLRTFGRF